MAYDFIVVDEKSVKFEIVSKTYGSHFILIDKVDIEEVSKIKWYVSAFPNLFYVRSNIYEDRPEGKKHISIKLHRFLMKPTSSDIHIDHINGNGLDNRRSNLRLVNRSQNLRNRRKNKLATSRYKGVTKIKGTELWLMQIMINGKNTTKRFAREVDAATEFNRMSKLHFGEYAFQNKVEDEVV